MVCGGLKASATDYIAGSIKMIEPAGMKTECHCEYPERCEYLKGASTRKVRVPEGCESAAVDVAISQENEIASVPPRKDIKNHSI